MVNNRPTPNRPNGPQAHWNAASSKAQNPKAATLNAASAITASAMAARANPTSANVSRSGSPYQTVARAAAPGYAAGAAPSPAQYPAQPVGRPETQRTAGAAATTSPAPNVRAAKPAVRDVSAVDDDHWHVQVAAGDVRVVTLDKLDDLYRYDVVDNDTFVWQRGMSNWKKLGSVLDEADVPATASIYVQLGPDNVKPVTLEQLGDYFRYGTVDGSTPVWTASTNQWTSLATAVNQGALAGEQAAVQATVEEPDDPFFVVFGPGDVRELTLEQLDDFYRCGVITESTMLWQKGMSEWQPLSKVAGLDEKPAPVATATAPVRTPVTTAPAPTRNAPQPRLAPVVAAVAPATVLIPSSPPVSFDIEPEEPIRSRRSWSLRLAVAAGLLLTLARNDVLLSALGPAGLEGQYVAMEQSLLGGPAFGTERAVESLVKSCGGHLEPIRLPIVVEQSAKGASDKDVHRAASEPSISSRPADVSPTTSNTGRTPSSPSIAAATPAITPSTASQPGAATKAGPTTLAAAIAQSAAGDSHKAASASRAPTKTKAASSSRAAPRSNKPRGGGKSSLQSGGNYYDPLNSAL